MMSDSFSVVIRMSTSKAATLQDKGYQLFAFKGVDGPPGTKPVVWFQTDKFAEETTVDWREQYSGYTSTSDAIAGTRIKTLSSEAMNLGQILNVGKGGIGTVGNKGTDGEISIFNKTGTDYTCGVSVLNLLTETSNPICALDLMGNSLDTFVPIEVVSFMFATPQYSTGTVIEEAFSAGIVINVTGFTEPVTVSYGDDGVWSGPAAIATSYAATDKLLPLLVNPGGSKAVARRAAQRHTKAIAA
jgi:hypothetical protein